MPLKWPFLDDEAIFEVMFDEGLAIFAKIVLKESILPQQPDSKGPIGLWRKFLHWGKADGRKNT